MSIGLMGVDVCCHDEWLLFTLFNKDTTILDPTLRVNVPVIPKQIKDVVKHSVLPWMSPNRHL